MMHSQKLTFPSAQGATLAARLDLPAAPPCDYALFAHCFTCNKDIFAASRIAERLADNGIAVLRFDFTGLGHSDGEFANTNFSSNVEDLVAAADYLREHHAAPRLLIGHSLGGAAVLAAAEAVAEVEAVATIGAPADPGHVAHLLQGARAEIEAAGEAEIAIAGRKFRVRKQFLDDIAEQNLAMRIARLRTPLLILHAPRDEIVGIDNATQIFVAAKHPKSFVSLDDADHLLTRRRDANYAADMVATWASRYIGAEQSATPWPQADAGEVAVVETGEGKFSQAIAAGRHRLRADEPIAFGGGDSGPGPYDLLLAALGARTSMTLRMYADRKKWRLRQTLVRLRHDKIHAEDCADCETRDGKIDRIECALELLGDLSDAQRARLLEIAEKCPVHRSLKSEVSIATRLAG